MDMSITETLGFDPQNLKDFLQYLVTFCFNLLVVGIIVRGLYYAMTRRKNYMFSYLLIGVIVFIICSLLNTVSLQIGFALGLFAIFGIIRYRTNPVPIKEMTYLFVVIGISVTNALANENVSYLSLVFTNVAVILIIYYMEKVWIQKNEAWKIIEYEKIELIKPENRAELISDLKERTGLDITKIEIGAINFLRDTVKIKIIYMETHTITEGIESSSLVDDGND